MATATATGMSTASAAALAAACSSRSIPSPLPTPQSAGFPSALSPLPSSGFPKSARTPLTPPAAYLDFLRIVDKGLKTPLSSNSTSFPTSYPSDLKSPYAWPRQPQSARAYPTPIDRTEISTSNVNSTTTSSANGTACAPPTTVPTKSLARRASDPSSATAEPSRSTSANPLPPPPPRRPSLARRPSVIIPESPSTASPTLMSPASVAGTTSARPPLSATVPSSATAPPSATAPRGRSPASASAAKRYYQSLSPAPAVNDTNDAATPAGYTPASAAPHGSGVKRPFSVRHVITRTVTYTRPAGTTATVSSARLGGAQTAAGRIEEKASVSPKDPSDKTPKRALANSFDPVRESASQEREREREEAREAAEAELQTEAEAEKKTEKDAEPNGHQVDPSSSEVENVTARGVSRETWPHPQREAARGGRAHRQEEEGRMISIVPLSPDPSDDDDDKQRCL